MQKLNLVHEPHVEPAPDATALDHAMTAAKLGALAFTPVLPFLGPGVAFIDLLTAPLRGKRMNDWCEEFRLCFNDLAQKVEGLTWERLEKNEAFFSTFAQATQSAIKSHQAEKLEALRNAVLNVALGREPDPNRQHQFLALVDRFSETHLVVLKFLNDPARYFQLRGEPGRQLNHVQGKLLINTLVAKAFPALRTVSEDPNATSFQFIELILGDLVSSHLVTFERHHETWAVPSFAIKPGGGPVGKMTKHFGEDFLAFIAAPDLDEKLTIDLVVFPAPQSRPALKREAGDTARRITDIKEIILR
jgi:hypothetical protein